MRRRRGLLVLVLAGLCVHGLPVSSTITRNKKLSFFQLKLSLFQICAILKRRHSTQLAKRQRFCSELIAKSPKEICRLTKIKRWTVLSYLKIKWHESLYCAQTKWNVSFPNCVLQINSHSWVFQCLFQIQSHFKSWSLKVVSIQKGFPTHFSITPRLSSRNSGDDGLL